MDPLHRKPDSLAVRLRELGARFAERCLVDLATLERGLGLLRAGDLNATAEIEAIAHRISGTGATLGFPEISDAAAKLEREAGPSRIPDVDRLALALAELRTAVAREGQKT